ncbi:MAG: hypothetical protein QM813_16580 [Verrucomicrobiota bacterium]
MQSQESSSRSATTLNHPNQEEWTAYLYDEVTAERKEELFQHLANCSPCGRQLNEWRASIKALDDWKVTALCRKPVAWPPAVLLRWAVAAALVLCVGFAVGRISSQHGREVAELKATVAQLMEYNNKTPVTILDASVRAELIRLLTDYSKLNEERRTEDRRVVGLALREMELRLGKLRTELETVALNTETGFQQTKEGLTTLASYAVADHGEATDLNGAKTKN